MPEDKQVSGTETQQVRRNPGDEVPRGTPCTGEDVCPECKGSGRIANEPCANCGGAGKVIRAIGGA